MRALVNLKMEFPGTHCEYKDLCSSSPSLYACQCRPFFPSKQLLTNCLKACFERLRIHSFLLQRHPRSKSFSKPFILSLLPPFTVLTFAFKQCFILLRLRRPPFPSSISRSASTTRPSLKPPLPVSLSAQITSSLVKLTPLILHPAKPFHPLLSTPSSLPCTPPQPLAGLLPLSKEISTRLVTSFHARASLLLVLLVSATLSLLRSSVQRWITSHQTLSISSVSPDLTPTRAVQISRAHHSLTHPSLSPPSPTTNPWLPLALSISAAFQLPVTPLVSRLLKTSILPHLSLLQQRSTPLSSHRPKKTVSTVFGSME